MRDAIRQAPSLRTSVSWLLLCALAASGPPAPAGAQVQEEDLVLESAGLRPADELRSELDEALELFQSVRQPDSIPLFTSLIESLGAAGAALDGERRDLLTTALFRRAEARLNLGENDAAAADLEAAVRVHPGFSPDLASVSPKLRDMFRQARDRVVGYLEARLEPADATVRIDGEPLRLRVGEPTPVLAGAHEVVVERPGFEPWRGRIEVAAGGSQAVEATLERTSAVVFVRTSEPGVEVVVDGVSRGLTVEGAALQPPAEPEVAAEAGTPVEGEPELAPPPVEAGPRPAELAVDGLGIGDHVMELRKEGFRSRRTELAVDELIDYEMGVAELEATRGTLTVTHMPGNAALSVNGEVLFPAGTAEGEVSVELPVGEHHLLIDAGTLGAFEDRFALEDQEVHAVDGRLRPRLTVLGVLGGDSAAAGRLLEGLDERFAEHPHWLFQDRSQQAPEALAALGVDAVRFRTEGPESVDWEGVQRLADRDYPGSVYLLAVLSDDLFAGQADLFSLPSAPAAPLPDRARIDLDGGAGLDGWYAGFAGPPGWDRPWVGAALVDSPLGEGPVVAAVDPEGPAAEAGLAPGDVLVAAAGSPTPDARAVVAALAGADAGGSVGLTVRRGAVTVEAPIAVVRAAAIAMDPDGTAPAAAVSAWLALEEARGELPAWLMALNRAAIYRSRGAWPEVVRALRGADAPVHAGLGQATVDYWLGVALLETDPASYGEQARAALGRAAEAASGRLEHADGPSVAMRARARLEALETP